VCIKSRIKYTTSFIILHPFTASSITVAVNTLTIARDGVFENCTAYDSLLNRNGGILLCVHLHVVIVVVARAWISSIQYYYNGYNGTLVLVMIIITIIITAEKKTEKQTTLYNMKYRYVPTYTYIKIID
jgi:hypothetical protein